jgi:hypothetical protein
MEKGQTAMADKYLDPTPQSSFPKQAVVVIHGMGEQIPMGTISNFVRAAWESDKAAGHDKIRAPMEVWSKPDNKTGSLELRRITTRQSRDSKSFSDGVRTDFFELYWADLSDNPTWGLVKGWVFSLLWRNPVTRVPHKLLPAWILMWLVTIVVAYALAAVAVTPDFAIFGVHPFGIIYAWPWGAKHWVLVGTAVTGLFLLAANKVLVPYFGRVVRYLQADPDNIAARKAIRERGMALLDALHDGTYERIIIVGHSLGSILGYDLLNYFWAARPQAYTFASHSTEMELVKKSEVCVADLRAAAEVWEKEPNQVNWAACEAAKVKFHAAQRALGEALRKRPRPARKPDGTCDPKSDTRWLVTDFVTLGSPLTHADFLMTKGRKDFIAKIENRQYSVSPPVREIIEEDHKAAAIAEGFKLDPAEPRLMCFPFSQKGKRKGAGKDCWQLHHAAPFAATRWTNLHDPSSWLYQGDMVSGPVGGTLFGVGVEDVDLKKTNHNKQSRWFSHTWYWKLGKNGKATERVKELRKALDLPGDNL